jgi:hypothetical protein
MPESEPNLRVWSRSLAVIGEIELPKDLCDSCNASFMIWWGGPIRPFWDR